MNVKSITVVNNGGADTLFLTTDLPNPIWPYQADGATFKIESATSRTDEWLETNFPGISVKKVKVRGYQ
jgi:hypothetical protein